MRFTNQEIFDDIEAVLNTIAQILEPSSPNPFSLGDTGNNSSSNSPLLRGEGLGVRSKEASAALWTLLEPQWKDPKKWWSELSNAKGKKDYDWSHLAAGYFPKKCDCKCQQDPSLAVAHGCFWRYHPEKAYQWELRLQDEIDEDFTIDEVNSDELRQAMMREYPDKVEELQAKEQQRRQRNRDKANSTQEGDR